MRQILFGSKICVGFLAIICWLNDAVAAVSTDAEIRNILRQRVGDDKDMVGAVVGVIDPHGRRVVSYGSFGREDQRPVDGDTIFEIGSITKVFTALLLADMVQKGEVHLDDPVSKYLPPGVIIPQREGHAITLVDLATHTSGLPRMPANFPSPYVADTDAEYPMQRMYDFLAGYSVPRAIGKQYEYSNLGFALLADALAHRAETDYETLIRSRILRPLKMSSTTISITSALQPRVAGGHDLYLDAVPNWVRMIGAGGMYSSGNDMLAFLAAFLGYTKSPLSDSMTAMIKTRRSIDSPSKPISDTAESGLGWVVFSVNGKETVGKGGLTRGYAGYVTFDKAARSGVVVLSNTADLESVQDIGNHLLNPEIPLRPSSPRRKQIRLDPAAYDNLVGTYQLAPNRIAVIKRDGEHLIGEIVVGEGKAELFPESEKDFFVKAGDGQVTFIKDTSGRAAEIVVRLDGKTLTGKRVSAEEKKLASDIFEKRSHAAVPALGVQMSQALQDRPDWAHYFSDAGVAGTIVVRDERHDATWVYNKTRAQTRYIPASTFKVPHTLFALDAGVARDEFQIFPWDGVKRETASWNHDQNLRSAMRNSVVWVYQGFARELGETSEREYLQRVQYGNADPSGGLDHFWLDGALRISAQEQLAFLQKLYRNELPFRTEHQRLVKDMMIVEAGSDWVLRAKTGWGAGINPQIGWWVGWVERPEGVVFFSLNIDMPQGQADTSKRQAIARSILSSISALPVPSKR